MTLLFSLLACTIVAGSGNTATAELEVEDFSAFNNATLIDVSWTQGEPAAALTCDDNLLDFLALVEDDSGALTIQTDMNVILRPTVPCTLELQSSCLGRYAGSGSGGLSIEESCELQEISLSGSGGVEVAHLASDSLDIDLSGSGGVFVESAETGPLSVHLSGSGGVAFDSLIAGDVDADFSGSGGLSAAGEAGDLDLDTSGSGGLDAQGLSVEDAAVHISGSGSSSVAVYGALDADLTGSGSLYVYGDPVDATVSSSGSGEVVIAGD